MFYVAVRLSRANSQSKPHSCHCWTHTEASKAIHSREAGKKQCGNAVSANETGTSRQIFDFPPICHLLPASNMQNKWALSILQFQVSKLPKWWGFITPSSLCSMPPLHWKGLLPHYLNHISSLSFPTHLNFNSFYKMNPHFLLPYCRSWSSSSLFHWLEL